MRAMEVVKLLRRRGPRFDPLYRCERCGHCHSGRHQVDPVLLRSIRLKSRKTLKEVADRFSVTARYLCDIENGNRRCPDWLLIHYGLMGKRSDLKRLVLSEVERYFKSFVTKNRARTE